ncbi:MAG TPA: hypothetical protein VI248_24405 [Kineosporiaceae bacterium]
MSAANGNAFLTPRHGHRPAPTANVLVVVALVVAGLGFATLRSGPATGTSTSDVRVTAAATSTSSAADPATGSKPADSGQVVADWWTASDVTQDLPAGTGPVALPRGSQRVDGYWLGYPHSLTGAVAAAVEYARHSQCLDLACVDANHRMIISPDWPQGRARSLEGMKLNRKTIGLPDGVAVPAGASVAVSPMAFRLDADVSGPDLGAQTPQVRVMLLVYQNLAGPTIRPTNRVLVLPVPLHWDGHRWVIVHGDRNYHQYGAMPGTPKAQSLGWRDIVS